MAAADPVLNEYRAGVREINRLVLIGLLFALAVHCYVIEPYFLYKKQEQALQDALPAMEQSITTLLAEEERIRVAHQSVADALQQIRDALQRFPDQLRSALPEIAASLDRRRSGRAGQPADGMPPVYQFNQYMQQEAPPDMIAVPAEITDFEAGVGWYINRWFAGLLAELEERVVKPVALLDQGEKGNARALQEISRTATDTVKATIDAIDPHFWRSYGGSGGKVDVAAELRGALEAAFAPLADKVGELLAATSRERHSQEEKLVALKEAIAAARAQIALLGERLKAIESPFGPLPLRMTDLITLFPFLLVALVGKCAVVIQQAVSQQALLRQLFDQEGERPPPALIRYQLRSFVLAPSRPLATVMALTLWLFVLFLVFLRAAWLITGNLPAMGEAGPAGLPTINPSLYTAACLIGAVLFVGAATVILQVRRPSAATIP
ncbi:MAG: hypothetical protein ACOY4H_07160 [Thermodesulfobacteriota bacterium]